ncbi:MAG: hypothetical protein HY774_12545 [Acidobacteria bacterium]|nr:hypothetical protein [Acidobacteriota bacterium]
MSPCHLVTLSPCHFVTLSPCHPVTLSPCHPVTLSPCHPVTLSPCHLVTLSPCHPVTLSPCHLVTLSSCHLVTLSLCHSVTFPFSHSLFSFKVPAANPNFHPRPVAHFLSREGIFYVPTPICDSTSLVVCDCPQCDMPGQQRSHQRSDRFHARANPTENRVPGKCRAQLCALPAESLHQRKKMADCVCLRSWRRRLGSGSTAAGSG